MKFFHHRDLCAQILVLLWILSSASTSQAQQYRLRTQTRAKATQLVRSDLTIAAQRPFSQSLSLWGYNLAGVENTPLNLHLQLNYFNDFAAFPHRADPYLSHRFNRLSLVQAWIQWKVFSRLNLKVGRLQNYSIFAAKDIDGFALKLRLGDKTQWKTSLYGGRHVVGRPESLDPDRYDVQGKPIELRQNNDETEFIYGFQSRLFFDGASASIGYEKRFSSATSDERLAISALGNPTRKTLVSAHLSFHTIARRINRGQFNFTWKPSDNFYIRQGFEHIVPIFDASSIFNLFGTSPSQSLHTSVWYGNNDQGLEARAWIKSINADHNSLDLGGADNDIRTLGLALQYSQRLRFWGTHLRFNPSLSYQPSDEQNYARDQFIARINTRFHLYSMRVVAGSTFLWVGQDSTRSESFAFTQRLGVEFPTSFGLFSIASVAQNSNQIGNHLSFFGSFETELWL